MQAPTACKYAAIDMAATGLSCNEGCSGGGGKAAAAPRMSDSPELWQAQTGSRLLTAGAQRATDGNKKKCLQVVGDSEERRGI